jgi:predicted Zn-dependent peptidase
VKFLQFKKNDFTATVCSLGNTVSECYNYFMEFKRTVLENGIRLITVPMPALDSATVLVVVGTGSRYETEDNCGISHFLEHMSLKGTSKRPTAREIASIIDAMGGQWNAFTGKEVTGFYVKSAASHLDTSLDIISDILINSTFPKEEIEKERGVIIEEINMYEDTPIRDIPDVYERLIFGDNPLGWNIGGRKDVIKKVTREDFTDYVNKHYSPSNMSVVVAGGIHPEKTTEMVKKYFSEMKPFDTVGYEKVILKQDKPKAFLKKKKTEQVNLALGMIGSPLSSPDRYSLDVLAAILGGGGSSRLFNEIREKRGLAYYVRTMPQAYLDNGTFTTYSGLNKEKVDEAIKVILEEHRILKNNALTIGADELIKGKEMLKGHLVLEMEDSRNVAAFFGEQEILEQKIETPTEVLRKIDAVTSEDLHEMAKKYFLNAHLNLAIIGDFESVEPFEKLLEL